MKNIDQYKLAQRTIKQLKSQRGVLQQIIRAMLLWVNDEKPTKRRLESIFFHFGDLHDCSPDLKQDESLLVLMQLVCIGVIRIHAYTGGGIMFKLPYSNFKIIQDLNKANRG